MKKNHIPTVTDLIESFKNENWKKDDWKRIDVIESLKQFDKVSKNYTIEVTRKNTEIYKLMKENQVLSNDLNDAKLAEKGDVPQIVKTQLWLIA